MAKNSKNKRILHTPHHFATAIFAILCLVLLGTLLKVSYENKKLRYTIRDFAIVNEIPIKYEIKELRKIDKYTRLMKAPRNLIKAIGMSEKGIGSHTFGVKRINYEIQLMFPVEDWQLIMCIIIVKQEMIKYAALNNMIFPHEDGLVKWIEKNKKGFTMHLARRYCPLNEEVWNRIVLSNWRKFERIEEALPPFSKNKMINFILEKKNNIEGAMIKKLLIERKTK